MARLLLLGAGHAHLTIISRIPSLLTRGHEVVVVGPSALHFYSGMGPGMLGGTYTPEQISFPVKEMVERNGGIFIQDKATRIDANTRTVHLASGNTAEYDICSCNLGSFVPHGITSENTQDVFTVKPIENLLAARKRILQLAAEKRIRIAVIGGGPAALEVAGNAAAIAPATDGHEVLLIAGTSFMQHFPGRVRTLCRKELELKRVTIREGSRAITAETNTVTLSDGSSLSADIILVATGVVPSPVFKDSGLPTGPDGGLAVDRQLRCPAHPELFGGGDCIYFMEQPLAKVGVYAVRQNAILLDNVTAALEGMPLQAFDPGGDYLLIFNTGGGRGVLHKAGFTFVGKLAFFIKDWIDRRFMQRFQPH